jgi:very-short-patch-repair endonuclease
MEAKVCVAKQMRRTMAPMEARLWTRLRRNGLGVNFRRQQIVYGFIADFYCNTCRLVIEVDGTAHDADYDAERDRIFAQYGLRVLRFSNEEVQNKIYHVLAHIRLHLIP